MSTGAREARKAETREALLDAGAQLFGEQGLDVSLDAICERAGFTRGAFYVHFADRDDFLVAVMDRVGTGFLDSVLGGTGDDADLAATVVRFVSSVVSGDYPLTRAGGVRPHQLLDACARSPRVRARYVALVSDTITRLRRTVAGAQRRKLVRDDVDAEQVAAVMLAAVIGAQTMLELGVPVALEKAASTVVTMLAPRRKVTVKRRRGAA